MRSSFRIAAGIVGCQAIDEGLKQFLLEGSCNFLISDQFKSRFDETADFRMEADNKRLAAPATVAVPDLPAAKLSSFRSGP